MIALRPLLLATLIIVPLALASTPSVQDRNAAFVRALVGEDVPLDTPVTMADGRVLTLAEAIDGAAARAGSVDLAQMVAGQVGMGTTYIGDIWLLASGAGTCEVTAIAPSPLPSTSAHGQLSTYGGALGTMGAPGSDYLMIISWTTKEVGVGFGPGWTFVGQSDMYCFNFFGVYFAFPMLNGVVTTD